MSKTRIEDRAMLRSYLLGLLPLIALVGCIPQESPPDSDVPPNLNPEAARQALIDLIRSPDPGDLKDFPLEKFIKEPAVVDEDDPASSSWGPFHFQVDANRYTFCRVFGEAPRTCRWEYKGSFEFRNGQWVALPPRVVLQALGG
jgi:hypothetical protein